MVDKLTWEKADTRCGVVILVGLSFPPARFTWILDKFHHWELETISDLVLGEN